MTTTPAAASSTDPHANDAAPYGGGDPYADYRGGDFPFTSLVDLADRRLGAGVIAANDEFFAERENLLTPGPAVFDPERFGHKGKIMDGWETRRRRGADGAHPFPADDEHDWALIRLAAPGIVRGVIVDTAHFRGNYPQQITVEATALPGSPSPEDLLAADVKWQEIVPRTPVRGHAANGFTVTAERRFTHLRLKQHPDGGIARLRVHGEVVPDPAWLDVLGTVDLASVLHGGVVEDASDRFYSSPTQIIRPDLSRKMDDGWENRRRRVRDTNDWVRFRLAAQGEIRAVEIDTAYLKGNSAGWAALYGCDARTADPSDDASWFEILPRTKLQPDTPHRFALPRPVTATHVRLDVFPDGGVARMRLHGDLTDEGRAGLVRRFDELSG
ncbi:MULTISPECIES: allantoicase [Streptomyces]|uniref:Probable allantoicase n=2 Tax=Streptomyces rimosus subsp. rimosus TaxID=132474 RepID=L8EQI8_STRR1|nr:MULTISPECIES: allantoicase [Streptomyces]KOG71907.1 allantoicase [Kitasatospora aureofaciens]MYT48646.1 allantoicase [Streptomyces sp. SID5471]KEF06079.1 allantoicase [Streptomyces rimosus]KOT26724.1 allantoicase [Streptomyces sp. NRRL WC-3701]KOT45188.1 allantoicase [Streptomyces rimosus subsp. rimosus]